MAGRTTVRLLFAGLSAALILAVAVAVALLILMPNLRSADYWGSLRDAVLGTPAPTPASEPEATAEVPAADTVAATAVAEAVPGAENNAVEAVEADTSSLDVLPGPYRNLEAATLPFALQTDIRYEGRLGPQDLPPDVLPSSVEETLEHSVDSASDEESRAVAAVEMERAIRRRGKTGADVCASADLQAGQRALMRRREFVLPWVRSGDLVMIQGDFPGNAFQRAKLAGGRPLGAKPEVSMAVHGPSFEYFRASLNNERGAQPDDKEQLALVFKAEKDGAYRLIVKVDDCTAAGSIPYALQVRRRGARTQSAADAAPATTRTQALPASSLPLVEVGDTYQGRLRLAQPLKGAYSPSTLYSTLFQDMRIGPLVKGKRYLIEVASPDIDPALQLFQRGPLVGDTSPRQDTDGGAHGNAMLVYQPTLDGPHILRVLGTDPRDAEREHASFGYQVRVSEWTQ